VAWINYVTRRAGKASGTLTGKASGTLTGKASGTLTGKASGTLTGKASGIPSGIPSGRHCYVQKIGSRLVEPRRSPR
jgi:hypothetical protein